jgi:hypothetical protein
VGFSFGCMRSVKWPSHHHHETICVCVCVDFVVVGSEPSLVSVPNEREDTKATHEINQKSPRVSRTHLTRTKDGRSSTHSSWLQQHQQTTCCVVNAWLAVFFLGYNLPSTTQFEGYYYCYSNPTNTHEALYGSCGASCDVEFPQATSWSVCLTSRWQTCRHDKADTTALVSIADVVAN